MAPAKYAHLINSDKTFSLMTRKHTSMPAIDVQLGYSYHNCVLIRLENYKPTTQHCNWQQFPIRNKSCEEDRDEIIMQCCHLRQQWSIVRCNHLVGISASIFIIGSTFVQESPKNDRWMVECVVDHFIQSLQIERHPIHITIMWSSCVLTHCR